MKTSKWFDLLFIIFSAIILVSINYFGNSELLGQFSLIVALVGYFTGKAVKNYEIKKNFTKKAGDLN